MKTALVCGAGGFIGGHLVKWLAAEGFWVRGVDLRPHEFAESEVDEFVIGDLRDRDFCGQVVDRCFDEVYQLAADMGGAGFVFTGENDADIMHNSATINLNIIGACHRRQIRRVFYASSACVYPVYDLQNSDSSDSEEGSAYPAAPDSEYGWEKLFSERLYLAWGRCHGLEPRIARYHNVFGPEGTWRGGREKAPAALCRKIAAAVDGGAIEIWGDGRQIRSFLYVSECIEATVRLMRSGFVGPLNIGSDYAVTIDDLADMIMKIAGKRLEKQHVPGPVGVPHRNSNNRMIRAELGWQPRLPLASGLEMTYEWIDRQVRSETSTRGANARSDVQGSNRSSATTEAPRTVGDQPNNPDSPLRREGVHVDANTR